MTPPRKQGRMPPTGMGAAATPAPANGAGTDGFDRWVRRQLHQVYDPAVADPLPDRLADLLERFPAAGSSTDADEPGGGKGDG